MASDFPCWMYGPDGAAAIFDCAEDIPAGWADSPVCVGTIHPLDRDRNGAKGGSLPKRRRRKAG
jgi:hypothetical protein